MKKILYLFFTLILISGCDNKKIAETKKDYFICEGQTIHREDKREKIYNFKRTIIVTQKDTLRKNAHDMKLETKVYGNIKFDGKFELEICSKDELNLYIRPTCDVSSDKEQRKYGKHGGKFEKVTGWFIYEEEYQSRDGINHLDEYFYKCSPTKPVIE
jgi:hypothetical protein